jgi:hypothetical protein
VEQYATRRHWNLNNVGFMQGGHVFIPLLRRPDGFDMASDQGALATAVSSVPTKRRDYHY